MKNKSTKNWTKRIILTMLIAFVVVINAPTLITYFSNSAERTNTALAEPPAAGAAGAGAAGAAGAAADLSPAANDIAVGLKTFLIVQQTLNRLLWPVLVMIGGLLDNSLLFGSGMEEHLREIWIPIRNIVNILFVIALVGIAIYNVLGIGGDDSTYSIKAILPKIIIGIIAVNFSFLGIKVFLDAINMVTTSIFTLPNQINPGLAQVLDPNNEADKRTIERFCTAMEGRTVEEDAKMDEPQIKEIQDEAVCRKAADAVIKELTLPVQLEQADKCDVIKQKLGAANQTAFDTKLKAFKAGDICTGWDLTAQGKLFLSKWGARNAALALAINMGKVLFFEDVDSSSINPAHLTVNIIFSSIMYLIYDASFIALFIVLMARLVVMWLSIALSPIILLGIAVPAIKEKVSALDEIAKQFMQNAIAPLGIALSMTIGWIMLNAMQSVSVMSSSSSTQANLMGGSVPVFGLNTLQDMVVAIGTVAVVWVGVFTAADKTIANGATNFIKEKVGMAGKFLGTMPLKHFPLAPIKLPSGETIPGTFEQIEEAIDRGLHSRKQAGALYDYMTGEKGVNADYLLEKGRTGADAQRWLTSKADRLTEAATLKELREFKDKRIDAYSDLYTKMPPEQRKALDILTDGKAEPAQIKEAAEKVARYAKATFQPLDGDSAKGKTPPKDAKKAGATKPEAPPITTETKVGGNTLATKGVDATDATEMDKARETLQRSLESGALERPPIEAQLITLVQHSRKAITTPAELKEALGKDLYDGLNKGVEGGLEARFPKIIEAVDGRPPLPPPAPAPAPTPTLPPAT